MHPHIQNETALIKKEYTSQLSGQQRTIPTLTTTQQYTYTNNHTKTNGMLRFIKLHTARNDKVLL